MIDIMIAIVIIVNRWSIVSPGAAHSEVAGTPSPESPRSYRGIVEERSFGIGLQYHILE